MEERILLQLVFDACRKEPKLISKIIDAGTEGIKAFADKQNDRSSKLCFMMSQILEEHSNKQFGPFSRKDILDAIEPCLGGTTWHNEEMKKL